MSFFDSIGDWFGNVGSEISSSFSDLTSPQGLQDFGNVAGMAAPFFAPAAVLGATGAFAGGAGAAGAAEGASALGFAEGAGAGAGTEAGLPSWFAGLGEGGLSGGVPPAEAGTGLSDWLALTSPEGVGGAGGAGLDGTAAGVDMSVGSLEGAGDAFASAGGMDGTAASATGGEFGSTAAKGQSFWDKIVGGATNSLTKNPLGIGAAALGLGMNVLKGQKDPAEMEALRGQAGDLGAQAKALNAQGQQLASYLQSGTLPPGLAASVKTATDAMKARIISNHAKNGMSTDPTQNSALAQELSMAEMNAVSMTAALGQQLMQSGQNFLKMGTDTAGLSERIYESLVRLDREQSKATGQAIASFAAALGGGQTLRLAA